MSLHEDLRELAANPLSYGQETHGELHADALAHIERYEEAIRKILEGSESVRHKGLVEAARIYNKARGVPTTPKTGFDALSDVDKAEWAAMIAEQRDPETKACGCGYPKRECLRVVLRNGPPYPPRPCEPVPPEMKPCENCGHVERIYFTCPACGVSFEVASETSTRIFCSTTCRRLTYETPVSTDRKRARELLAEAVGA